LYRNGIPYYYVSEEKEFLEEIQKAGFQIKHFEKIPPIQEYAQITNGWLWVDAIKPNNKS
jgi:hypothetical protein